MSVMSVREISETLAAGRAAQELRLKRGEFELAAQLGHVRTVGGLVSGRRRVARGEIERLRRSPGFPEALRERVRTVGTAEGAELLGVSSGRFTRLARAGYLVPVRFYLNRYRAVVWLYLAEDLRLFASGEPGLLTGRLPRTRTGEGAGRTRGRTRSRGSRPASPAPGPPRSRTAARATGATVASVCSCTRATTGGSGRRSSGPSSIRSNWPSWCRIRTSGRV